MRSAALARSLVEHRSIAGRRYPASLAGSLYPDGIPIEGSKADVVVSATPIDLARLLAVEKPIVRARYEFAEAGEPTLGSIVDGFAERLGARLGGRS
jgi:predicted GTPase